MSKDIAGVQNLSLACSLIAIRNTAPEQGKRNLDGDKSQLMLVSFTEYGHPTTAVMETMWKCNVMSDKFSLAPRSRMCNKGFSKILYDKISRIIE
jgi:hypothetical protein